MIREKGLLNALDLFDRGYSVLESADSINLMASEFEDLLRHRQALLREAFNYPLTRTSLSGWEKRRKPRTLPVFEDCPNCGQQHIARRTNRTNRTK